MYEKDMGYTPQMGRYSKLLFNIYIETKCFKMLAMREASTIISWIHTGMVEQKSFGSVAVLEQFTNTV